MESLYLRNNVHVEKSSANRYFSWNFMKANILVPCGTPLPIQPLFQHTLSPSPFPPQDMVLILIWHLFDLHTHFWIEFEERKKVS